ncbi:TPA: hypothetical protein ACH3X2_006154 [Trebouxia sp. C0005]
MRAGTLPRSPRTVACALIAVSVCFFVPFKLSRDSEVLDSVEQPAHLTCSGAPVRKTTSWLPGKAGALTDLHTDEKTVKHYIEKCVLPSRIAEEEVTGSGAKVGIAIPAGGKWLLSNTLAVCTVLRKTLKSALPVEVVYNGPEEYDELLVSQLEALPNVTCLDARQVAYPRHHPPLKLKGLTFEFKAFVLAYVTTFDQVLMLDADNFPLRSPDDLFTVGSAELGNLFKQHGSLFWPDFGQKQGDKSILLAKHLDIKAAAYTEFNLTLPWEGMREPFLFTESGQMLFDRARHADVLEWLWFLNSHRKPVSDWMWGDKDTYRLAFALAGKANAFQQVTLSPRLALDAGGTPPEPPFRHTGMVQHDLDGNLQFLHRTYLGKFDPAIQEPWRELDFVTNPVTPQQALIYAEAYGFFPHQVTTDYEKYCCPGGSDTSDVSECRFKECKVSGNPLPVLTIAAANLDPGVRMVLNALDDMFTALQANQSAKSG